MSSAKKLRAALAAVPVGQPCTGAAVGALYAAGHATLKGSCGGATAQEVLQLREALSQQGVPGACMPVLAWLAAGLRSSLPSAAVQQAHEMACLLLMVTAGVTGSDLLPLTGDRGVASARGQCMASRTLRELGSSTGGLPSTRTPPAHTLIILCLARSSVQQCMVPCAVGRQQQRT